MGSEANKGATTANSRYGEQLDGTGEIASLALFRRGATTIR